MWRAGRWQQYDDASGSVTIAGRVQPSQILFGRAAEQAASSAGSPQAKDEWFRIDIEAMQGQMPYQLLPVYLLEAPGPQGNIALPYRIEPEVDLSEGPHLGYALQWFAFAIVAGVVYVGALRSRLRKAEAPQDQSEEPGTSVHGRCHPRVDGQRQVIHGHILYRCDQHPISSAAPLVVSAGR